MFSTSGRACLTLVAGDEGKPRCQRCIDGGFECQYGTRLSFLQKNAITAQAEAPGPSSGAYRRVQVSPVTIFGRRHAPHVC